MDLCGILLTEPMAFFSPALISSLLTSLYLSIPPCLSVLYLNRVFFAFLRFRVLYRCMKCAQVPCGLVDVDVSPSM